MVHEQLGLLARQEPPDRLGRPAEPRVVAVDEGAGDDGRAATFDAAPGQGRVERVHQHEAEGRLGLGAAPVQRHRGYDGRRDLVLHEQVADLGSVAVRDHHVVALRDQVGDGLHRHLARPRSGPRPGRARPRWSWRFRRVRARPSWDEPRDPGRTGHQQHRPRPAESRWQPLPNSGERPHPSRTARSRPATPTVHRVTGSGTRRITAGPSHPPTMHPTSSGGTAAHSTGARNANTTAAERVRGTEEDVLERVRHRQRAVGARASSSARIITPAAAPKYPPYTQARKTSTVTPRPSAPSSPDIRRPSPSSRIRGDSEQQHGRQRRPGTAPAFSNEPGGPTSSRTLPSATQDRHRQRDEHQPAETAQLGSAAADAGRSMLPTRPTELVTLAVTGGRPTTSRAG